MKNIQQKFDHRIFGMDILRILCALFIFLRHSHTMFGCRYGEIAEQIILDLTEPIMTCFFIVSGFSLYYVYGDKGDFTGQKLKKFYLKRAITILPSYYCVHVIYLLLHMEQRKEWVILTPIDLVGIQTFFNTLFGILHNGGSWFVSCIIVCYLLYPIMQMLVNETSVKWQITTLCMLHLLLVYSQYVTSYFQLGNNYSNPLFRLLEFACGILAASILKTKSYKHMFECGGGGLVYLFFISVMVGCGIVNIKLLCRIPVIIMILGGCLHCRCEMLEQSKCLHYLSMISYQFYLSQFSLWKLLLYIMPQFCFENNVTRIIFSLICCLVMSVLMYECIDKKIQRKFQNIIP